MTKRLVFYRKHLAYDLTLKAGKTILISPQEGASLVLEDLEAPIRLTLEDQTIHYQVKEEQGHLADGQTLLDVTFYEADTSYQVYDLLDKQELILGSLAKSDIYIADAPFEILLSKEKEGWQLHLLSGSLYLNNQETQAPLSHLKMGDQLTSQSLVIKVFPEEVWLWGKAQVTPNLIPVPYSRYDLPADFPDYERSPRLIYRSSEDQVTINAPEKEPKKPEDGLLRMILPPIVMVAVTALISIFQPRGLYIIMSITMSFMTMIFSVTNYFKRRKEYKEAIQKRIKTYQSYLSDKAIELNGLAQEQKAGQLYHYPDLITLDKMAKSYSHRIYEKTPQHFDFLYYRLGLGNLPTSYDLSYNQLERSGQIDPLEAQGYALYQRQKAIQDLPVLANLAHGPVGYI